MTARTLQEMHGAFQQAFNERDIDRLMTLYEENAVLVPQPGSVASGTSQIREALQGFLALNGPAELVTTQLVEIGDIAFLSCRWSISGTGPDGNPLTVGGRTAEVARQQADGSWRYVYDDPVADQTLMGS